MDTRSVNSVSLRRGLPAMCLFFGLCLVALSGAAPGFAQDVDALGEVVRQKGPVTAFHAPAARSLHLGAAVYEGDKIITPADAKVEIRFTDGSTLALGAETEVEITRFAAAGQKPGALTLLLGIIRTNLTSLWSGGFEVRTRAAIASVRSTEWVTEAKAEGTAVFVVDGKVAVAGANGVGQVLLSKDQGTDVRIGAAPTPAKAWGPARVADVLERTRLP